MNRLRVPILQLLAPSEPPILRFCIHFCRLSIGTFHRTIETVLERGHFCRFRDYTTTPFLAVQISLSVQIGLAGLSCSPLPSRTDPARCATSSPAMLFASDQAGP